MTTIKSGIVCAIFCMPLHAAFGQASNDSLALEKIRTAANIHSSISSSLNNLADINGPRLLGTLNYFRTAGWVKQQLISFGVDEVQFESFDQQFRGWTIKSFNVEMTVPDFMHIVAYPLAYTQPTKGTVSGSVVLLDNIDSFKTLKGKLKNKILLLGQDFHSFRGAQQIGSALLSKDLLRQAADNPDPNDLLIGYHSRRSTQHAIASQEKRRDDMRPFFQFCQQEGVLALLEPSDYPYGILHVDGNRNIPSYRKNDDIKPVASFVIANEHFGRLIRLIKQGISPVLKLHLDVAYNYNPEYNVNVIATMKGADSLLQKEQVMIGAHLDSWHGGTGAVDNAAGCAVMIEAMRLLKAAGLNLKRSVKLSLWGGEEQVFAGSRKYIDAHVGDLMSNRTKPDFANISAYFNLDNGTGKIRGIYAQGNSKIKPILEAYLAPFNKDENGFVTLQYSNQTDHELFDALNIPAFQFIQDPLNYISAVHHTNMDVVEYVNQKDLRESAIIVAFLVYKVAMRDSLLPRRDYISVLPSLEGTTSFFLKGFENARSVSLVSDFNNWNMFGTPMVKVDGGWTCRLALPKGRYLYKYIVDGDWTSDPQTPVNKLMRDGKGHAGLNELIVE
ncbi:M20/M25/M40 family metallo-hydrolase [Terrimonas sp. NA20]|uniref:Carboxypeptidase Q n=1 Tax=Terrimonas ginsenosidimutans TaxID=2908004 RepID=A0ABS9KSW1_9BACT|nr:M20/M25/M40 family metallo-hydrolase [Terrimonas ginsenosidimutans]MCG2615385.1 M20/M25/M40 family metallo-hydrolase [Terrimonas ginsenosidimutans]